MALSGFEPAPLAKPETERVRSGRRAALAVALIAIVVVGTLVWKPWDTGSATAPTGQPAFAATLAPPVGMGVPVPDASPDTGEASSPPGTPGPKRTAAPIEFGSVWLTSGSEPYVGCSYGPAQHGQRRLGAVTVAPPIITTGAAAVLGLVESVVFQPEVEANSLQGIFSTDWSYLTAARAQSFSLGPGQIVRFDAARIKTAVDKLPASAVLRVAVVINWIGADGAQLASQRLYPSSYAPLGHAAAHSVPDGCPAWVVTPG